MEYKETVSQSVLIHSRSANKFTDTTNFVPEELPKKEVSIQDYIQIKQLGKGSFGAVYLAKEKLTGKLVALKILEMNHVMRTNKVDAVMREKDLLV